MEQEKWSFAKAVTENIMIEPGKGSIDFTKLYEVMEKKDMMDGLLWNRICSR